MLQSVSLKIKTYLSEQGIGFREIYDGEQMTLQFTIPG